MRPILTITLVVLLAVAIDNGDAWGRSWVRKTLKKISRKVITSAAIKSLQGLLASGKDVRSQLASLKYNDRESYDNFMHLLKTDLENQFPLEEVDGITEHLDGVADMQPGELLLFDGEYEDANDDLARSEMLKELLDRVDALNSH